MKAYTISADGKSITCHQCGRTSYHPVDVREKFCGVCRVFHDDLPRYSMNIEIVEEHRQILLLALAELALSRPGWEPAAIMPIVEKLQGKEMFHSFKQTSAGHIKPAQLPFP